MKKYISLLIILFLFSSGCLKESTMKWCCNPASAEKDGECVFPDGTAAPFNNGCDLDLKVCTVAFEKDGDGNPKWEELPICTQEIPDDKCVARNCTIMLCGQFNYEPAVFGGSGISEETLNDAEAVSDAAGGEVNTGLYDGWCLFVPFNYQVTNVFENSEGGIYVNSFRFGTGSSFKEYEKYKLYFPITDKTCGTSTENPVKVDRYMNYLMPKQQTWNYISGSADSFNPLEEFDEDYCTGSGNWAEPLSTVSYGIESPAEVSVGIEDYVYIDGNEDDLEYNNQDWYKEFREALGEAGEYPMPPEEYYGPDKGFYRDALTYTYWGDITDVNTGRAPFECSTVSNDCLSGSCDTSIYSRTTCLLEGGAGAECLCEANSRGFYGDSKGSYIVCDAKTPEDFSYEGAGIGPSAIDYNFFEEQINRGDQEDLRYDVSFYVKGAGAWSTEGINFTTSDLDDISTDLGFYEKRHWVGLYLHKEIVFTGTPDDGSFMGKKDSKVGYSYMNAEDFEKSALVETCSLVKCELPEIDVSMWGEGGGSKSKSKAEGISSGTKTGSRYNGAGFDAGFDLPLLETELDEDELTLPEEEDTGQQEAEELINEAAAAIEQAYMDWEDTTDAEEKFWEAYDAYNEGDYPGAILLAQESIDMVEALYEEVTQQEALNAINRAKDMQESYSDNPDADPYFLSYAEAFIGFAEDYYAEGNYELAKEYARKVYDALFSGVIPDEDMPDESVDLGPPTRIMDESYLYQYAQDHNCDYFVFGQDDILFRIKNETGWHPGDNGHPDPPDMFGFYTHEDTDFFTSHVLSYAWVANNEIQIYSLGECVDDTTGNFKDSLQPQVTTFGWCEPCTYATLAYESTPGDAFEDSEDMKQQVNYYLKQDVLPILNYSNDNYWTYIDDNYAGIYTAIDDGTLTDDYPNVKDSDAYDFLTNVSGPVILMVANVYYTQDSEFWQNEGRTRAKLAKFLCPNCLIGVHISFPNSYWQHGQTTGKERARYTKYMVNRMLDVELTYRYAVDELPDDADTSLLNYVDILAWDFYPDEYTNNKDWCVGGEDQYGYILEQMTNQSKEILYRTGKPSIILGFGLRTDDECFTDDEIEPFFNYLFQNQKNMTKNALIGLVYSEVEDSYASGIEPLVENPSSTYIMNTLDMSASSRAYTEKFCSLQKGAQFLLKGTSQYIYHSIYLQDQVECTKCNSMDYTAGQCGNQNCTIGKCTLPLGADLSEYKCPEDTIQGTCDSCAELNQNFDCKITYSNGSTIHKSFNPSAVSDPKLYPEYLSNLYDGDGKPISCCVGEGANQSVFFKKGGTPKEQYPIVYSTTANPFEDCNFYQDATLLNSFCGVELSVPVYDYEVECAPASLGGVIIIP